MTQLPYWTNVAHLHIMKFSDNSKTYLFIHSLICLFISYSYSEQTKHSNQLTPPYQLRNIPDFTSLNTM